MNSMTSITGANNILPVSSIYVYDIECLSNFFSVVFIDAGVDDSPHTFYIHESRCDLVELQKFVKRVTHLIGYNNLHYDMPMLDYVLSKRISNDLQPQDRERLSADLYKYSQRIINGDKDTRVKKPRFKELDLFKMNHFDSKVKRVSLKQLQFAMRYNNVMDMPIHHSSRIEEKDIDTILEYNVNDVLSTKEFYGKCTKEISVRKTIGKKYNLDLTNDSEPRISKKVFGKILSESLGIDMKELNEMRTRRDKIDLSTVIFPYVKFETPEFNSILDFFKAQTITTLKGAFADIDVTDLDRTYMNPRRLKKIKRKSKNAKDKVIAKYVHTMFQGEEYVYGVGGIHSKIEGAKIVPKPDEMILDVDVVSYYPNIVIKNRLRPDHLPEKFCDVYEGVFHERTTYPKSDPSNYVLKIVLNATYGLSNNEHSYLYDPLLTCQITINGQLLISMLIEKICLSTDSRCVAANTDGASFVIKKAELEKVKQVCKEWEAMTMLKLEDEEYKAMYFRDVNNYIWVTPEGKSKLKGIFEPSSKKAWHKNFSQGIVGTAVTKYLTEGVSYEQTVRECNDIFEFCKSCRVTGSDKLVSRSIEGNNLVDEELSKLTRYYVSTSGTALIKKMKPTAQGAKTYTEKYRDKIRNQTDLIDTYQLSTTQATPKPRETNIEAGRYCTVFNVYKKLDISSYGIDYDYYVEECKKIIKSIRKSNETTKQQKKASRQHRAPTHVQSSLFM